MGSHGLPTLVILGDRTANEILETAQLINNGQYAAIEKLYFDAERFVAHDAPRLSAASSAGVCYHAGMANDVLKRQVVAACEAQGWQACSVIHPTAVIAGSANIGPGSFVGPLAVISSLAVIEAHCIVHLHASVGHDARVGAYSAILPGARISGNVHLGQRTLVGSNAFVAAGKTIGDDCRIDALTSVFHDLPAAHIVSTRYPRPLRRVDV